MGCRGSKVRILSPRPIPSRVARELSFERRLHEVLLIRRIRELLYEHGFTINGARNRLEEPLPMPSVVRAQSGDGQKTMTVPQPLSPSNIRKELKSILKMLER